MTAPERIVIPRCIGCGAMYEFETCEHGCREEHLELVAAGELDLLDAALERARARIDAALPVLTQLVQEQPAPGEWQAAYLRVAHAARRTLHAAPVPAWPPSMTDPAAVLRISVWRCPDCGAVDAPQECLGICIWRRFEWVSAAIYDARLTDALSTGDLDVGISGLLRRVAFATPRVNAWERSWRALSREAQGLIELCARTGEQQTEVHV